MKDSSFHFHLESHINAQNSKALFPLDGPVWYFELPTLTAVSFAKMKLKKKKTSCLIYRNKSIFCFWPCAGFCLSPTGKHSRPPEEVGSEEGRCQLKSLLLLWLIGYFLLYTTTHYIATHSLNITLLYCIIHYALSSFASLPNVILKALLRSTRSDDQR